MGVVWVIEKPGRGEKSMAGLLQGDVAVRAFASIRNFLKLGRLSALKPNAILVRGDDFAGDTENLEKLIEIHWPQAKALVVCGLAPKPDSRTYFVSEAHYGELPFIVQKLLAKTDDEGLRYLTAGELCLDFEGKQFRVLPHGEWNHLTFKETQILRYLMRFQDRYLSHEDLCNEIWKGVKVSPKSVSSHMSRLRTNLMSSHFTIESVYGGGYRLVHHDSAP
ncbi:MAG: response regulator transcription factor [Proteobacteria bacterium]|nr:MAG: response regulator transcription factor [Pseudomonadota bacterium]